MMSGDWRKREGQRWMTVEKEGAGEKVIAWEGGRELLSAKFRRRWAMAEHRWTVTKGSGLAKLYWHAEEGIRAGFWLLQ